jgi:hypothetical protein
MLSASRRCRWVRGRLFAARFIRCVREGRPRGDVHPAPSRFALGLWLRMKPKKRQPLDFTGIPVEPPVEDVGRPCRVRKPNPMRKRRSANRIWISISPPFPTRRPPPILDRGPLDLGPNPRPNLVSETPPVAETPRANARRGFFGSAKPKPTQSAAKSSPPSLPPNPFEPIEPPTAEIRRHPEPDGGDRTAPRRRSRTSRRPSPSSTRPRSRRPVVVAARRHRAEPLAPLPSFLTTPVASTRPSRRPRWSSPNRRLRPSVSKRRCPSRARLRRSRPPVTPCPRLARARSRCRPRCSGAWRSPPRRSGRWGRSPSRWATAPACRP